MSQFLTEAGQTEDISLQICDIKSRVNIPYKQRPFIGDPIVAIKNISQCYAETVDRTENIESSRTVQHIRKHATNVRNSIILRQYVKQTD